MRGAVLLLITAGCSFNPTAAGTPIGSDDAINPGTEGNDPVVPPDPLHLPPSDGMPGTGSVDLSGTVTIDTGVPSISVTLPGGATLDVRTMTGGGEAAVLHTGALTVQSGATVNVIGTRPLIVVAGGDVMIAGLFDAGAKGQTPGPGGALPGQGPGAGNGGGHGSNDSDTGGGGAGYAAAGANGGAITGCTVSLGTGGDSFGDATITTLVGGSGGAGSSGTTCAADKGGAGGGALQISSTTKITIASTGRINAGGGGGQGSTDCGASDVNSGTGGGSGGSIVLQAPAITSSGIVAANGGGAGGSSSTGNGNANPGNNATASLTAALGGTGPRAQGGSGGVLATPPTVGGNASCGGNSAGGGGSVGRIAVSSTYDGSGMFSPAPNASLAP